MDPLTSLSYYAPVCFMLNISTSSQTLDESSRSPLLTRSTSPLLDSSRSDHRRTRPFPRPASSLLTFGHPVLHHAHAPPPQRSPGLLAQHPRAHPDSTPRKSRHESRWRAEGHPPHRRFGRGLWKRRHSHAALRYVVLLFSIVASFVI